MTQTKRANFPIVAVLFFLSGFAALLYQVAWLREFSVVFGTSELAVVTVLAVYMGGLALGAALSEPFVGRIVRPVLVYGLLEAGIAVAALVVPTAMDWAGNLYAGILGGQVMPPDARGFGQPIFYLLAGFLILAVPTGLMGATLPVLMRSVVQSDEDVGPSVALLYGINTAGAVAGSLVASFFLLGVLGLRGTVWVGIAVNAMVFAIAALYARQLPVIADVQARTEGSSGARFFEECVMPLLSRTRSWRTALSDQPLWILPVMFAAGATTFTYEVVWTRILSHVMGSSVHAFATMLAAFLTGIALGGGLAYRWAAERKKAGLAFVGIQIAIALITLVVFLFLDSLLPDSRGKLTNFVGAGLVLLPPAVCIGLTFPLAVRILTPNESLAAKCTARVYAWNTVGAILGSVLAGFLLIPTLGFEGTIRLAVVVNILLALGVATLITNGSIGLKVGLAAATIGIAVFLPLNRPDAVLRSGVTDKEVQSGTDLYFAVGRTSTVRLSEHPRNYQIQTNGQDISPIVPKGAPPFFLSWHWLVSLPVVARPEAESALVVGLGGGVVVDNLPPTLSEIHVVELEEQVLIANAIAGPNRVNDPLVDPRLTVIINDARNALKLTGRKYDIIVSQPSQPWTAGASHLYTTEFAELAKSRLNSDGVFLQWISYELVDEDLLRTLVATLSNVYGHVRIYNPRGYDLMLLASDEPLDIESKLPAALLKPLLAEHLKSVGIANQEDLLSTLVLDESAVLDFSRGAELSSDNRNLMAMKSRYLADGLTLDRFRNTVSGFDPLSRPSFWNGLNESSSGINYAFLAGRLSSLPDAATRLLGVSDALDDKSAKLVLESYRQLGAGDPRKGLKTLGDALEANPDDAQVRYLIVAAQLNAVLTGRASPSLQAIVDGLPEAPAAVVKALGFERTGRWEEVAKLDTILAGTKPTDIWFQSATRLRASWRIRPGQDDAVTRAKEALRLIDDAIPFTTTAPLDYVSLRASAAAAAGDVSAALESSVHVAAISRDILNQARRSGRPIQAQQIQRIRAPLNQVDRLLQSHPEWRDNPRGEAVFGFVADMQEEFAGI